MNAMSRGRWGLRRRGGAGLLLLGLLAVCAATEGEATEGVSSEGVASEGAATEGAATEGAVARKCCPVGEHWERRRLPAKCARSDGGGGGGGSGEEAWSGYRLQVGPVVCSGDKPIRTRASSFTDDLSLQPDGSLMLKMPHALFPWVRHSVDEYCLDTFVTKSGTRVDALICFPEDQPQDNTIATIGMLVSCVFLLLTLAVYLSLPELRNMHGRVLMAYLSSLLVGFLFLATLQLKSATSSLCLPFTFIIYFSMLSAFFWLNVMCFDIWSTFSGLGHVRRSHMFARRRYSAYCVYAFGWPTALTALLAALEFTDEDRLPDYVVTPKLRDGRGTCFLSGDERLLFLYCPMLILCVANALLFVLTALRIARVRRETAVLKQPDSAASNQLRKDKQRLLLYVKLFVVMGVNWALEVVSTLFPKVPVLWKLTDAYNVFIGLTIFVIFICKRKIFRLLKKRYAAVVHGAVVSSSRSHTCSTRNASTVSREEVKLSPLASSPAAPPAQHPSATTPNSNHNNDVVINN